MQIYVVQPGDSLYSIARRFGTTADRIASDNAIASPNLISVGQSLVIVTPEESYVAAPGDTLFSIAMRFGVPIDQLWRNNPYLAGGETVKPGDVVFITLPEPAYDRDVAVTGYAYPFIDRDVLRTALPYLTYLSIFTYGINDDYSLITLDDDELIATAKEYGVAPIMMIATLNSRGLFSSELASEVLSDPEKRAKLIESIAETVDAKGYAGVEFDFEYIESEYADAYAELIRDTKARIAPKLVFADLAPKESAEKQGLLYEGHSYDQIGAAADKMLLMTYEYGYTYGPPQAVAPINQIRPVLDYAVSVIPSDKLLLGVPNYGYNWTLPYVSGESRAQSLSNVEAVELAAEKRAAIEFNETAKSPFFNYYDRTPEGPVQHEVWFEDPRSIDASLRQIDQYNLDGTGIWNIMRAFPQQYLVLNSLYNIRKENI